MVNAFLIVFCSIIVLINIFVTFIFIKYKIKNRSFINYNIFFCLIISLDNIIRLIHLNTGEEKFSRICKAQAFILTFFDKLIITLLCSFSIIKFMATFIGIDSYSTNKIYNSIRLIYILSSIFSIIISIIPTIIFSNQGYSTETDFCYVNTTNIIKKGIDSVIISVLFVFSLCCSIRFLFFEYHYKNTIGYVRDDNIVQRISDINHTLCRYFFDICINILIFIYLLLNINNKIPLENSSKELIHSLFCLIIEINNSVDKNFINICEKILTCQPINDNEERIEENEEVEIYEEENDDINSDY